MMDRALIIMDGRDIPHPETDAMLQAIYSRNPGPILKKIEEVGDDRAGKFMGTFYTGYSHDSIGDCGFVTIFIENVSLIEAKAVQHHELYIGQEASTRYLDFSKQGFVDPLQRPDLMQELLGLYAISLPIMIQKVMEEYPCPNMGEGVKVWEKACKARAFDILRCVLPCGVHTSLAWKTSLRNLKDHTSLLSVHPAFPVARLGRDLYAAARAKYPNSFPEVMPVPEIDPWAPVVGDHADILEYVHFCTREQISYILSSTGSKTRKRGSKLHPDINRNVYVKGRFDLDYGSYRDIQRHRHNQMSPLPIPRLDGKFHEWYAQQLDTYTVAEIDSYLAKIRVELKNQPPALVQYYLPLGMVVRDSRTMTLGQAVYLAETRSSKAVHPTLRPHAQHLGMQLMAWFPELKVHVDCSLDDFNLARGKHDIVKKEEK